MTPNLQEWEKEFDRRQWVRAKDSFLEYGDDDCPPTVNWTSVYSFISSLLKQQEIAWLERECGFIEKKISILESDTVSDMDIPFGSFDKKRWCLHTLRDTLSHYKQRIEELKGRE